MNDNNTPPINNQPAKKETWWDTIKFGILVLLFVIPFRMFVAQPFIVQGASMEPTFNGFDYLIVDELSYSLREPERGEVVIFEYPKKKDVYFIKRIIGLPGETVKIVGEKVSIVTKDGKEVKIDEPYIGNRLSNYVNTTLKDGEYFVMGDNRAASYDSRYWGPVTKEEMKGRAYLRLFPLSKVGYLPGDFKFEL